MASLISTFIIILVTLIFLTTPTLPHQIGFRAELIRLNHGQNLTKIQLMQRALQQSKSRVKKFVSRLTNTPPPVRGFQSPVNVGSGEFLMSLSIGTPVMPFYAIVDTGSDLIWTQCAPCNKCFDQNTPILDPTKSSTFTKTSCSNELCSDMSIFKCANDSVCQYMYTYGDESSTQGYLASDTLTFDDSSNQPLKIPNLGFGCGVNNQGGGFGQGSGLVGLGRGPLSLISQLGLTKFSYCLTTVSENKTSNILFGSLADQNYTISNLGTNTGTATSLIRNPQNPSFYYLSLEGITVGKTLIPIPNSVFEIQKDGSGGMIIDSGTTLTMIEESAFNLLKREFSSQMKLRVSDRTDKLGLDLCFDLPTKDVNEIEVPKVTMNFAGVNLELPGENYLIADPEEGIVCLAMAASNGLSIFGNIQQQNFLVLHDLEKETVSFFRTRCDQM